MSNKAATASAPTAAKLKITTNALPAGTVHANYTSNLTATGGVPPYTWSSTSGQLPSGLQLNLSTGSIAGTPTSAGSFSFVTTVQDSRMTSASAGFALQVSAQATPPAAPSTLQITSTALPIGQVQSSYASRIAVNGGVPPYTWTTGGQLPTGLTVDPTTGALSGIPTVAGGFSFTATVKDSSAGSVSNAFSISISAAPAPAISAISPKSGPTAGGTPVVITGTNFRPGATVQFGKFAASSVQVASSTQIRALSPAEPSGAVSVTAQNSDGQAATEASAFTFSAPTPPSAPPSAPPTSGAATEPAQSADDFVDSVGINVHLSYLDTPYANFPAVETALKGLGVRHIRDGLIDTNWTAYYDRLNELGRNGIKAILITSPTESASLLTAYPSRVQESFEGYEGPNEYDISGDANWAATLGSFVSKLHSAVESNPATSQFLVVGPSLTQATSFTKMTSAGSSFNDANLHNYLGGRNPGTPGWGSGGYGSIAWNLNLANGAWPGKPVITTETGYFTNPSKTNGVPEDVAGKYLPRVLLEQWMHGIKRTYLYELVDVGPQFGANNGYGLLHTDFSPKPGFNAVKNVMALLSDPGPAFQAGGLAFTLSGSLQNVHHLLLEKRDGTFYLAIWIEQPGYDLNAKKELSVTPQEITVQTGQQMKTTINVVDASGNLQTTNLGRGLTQTVEITDFLTILELSE